MTFKSDIFNVEYRQISNENYLHVINIEKIDIELKDFIDVCISWICYGSDDTDISIIKKELIHFFETKKNDPHKKTIKGAIAEFFINLYLLDIGFNQEYLFLNLEENSIKKGFDGYFTLSNEEWIFESKSGSINSANATHKDKISTAYSDLKKKVETKSTNNPWKNAFNHAKRVGSNNDIITNLKKLSDDFILEKYQKINDLNIIPGSTIFLEGSWVNIDTDDLEIKIKNYLSNKEFKGINVICVNNKSIELFQDYLNS